MHSMHRLCIWCIRKFLTALHCVGEVALKLEFGTVHSHQSSVAKECSRAPWLKCSGLRVPFHNISCLRRLVACPEVDFGPRETVCLSSLACHSPAALPYCIYYRISCIASSPLPWARVIEEHSRVATQWALDLSYCPVRELCKRGRVDCFVHWQCIPLSGHFTRVSG